LDISQSVDAGGDVVTEFEAIIEFENENDL
jgi:hypothetical protein